MLSESDVLQLLQQRARALSERPVVEEAGKLGLTLFTRAGQLFGLRVQEVEGAGRLRDMSSPPGAPPWMVGALQYRGGILSLIDLAAFWGLEAQGVADLPTYLIVSDGRSRVGVLVEELLGVQDVEATTAPYQGVERSGVSEVARQQGSAILVVSASRLLQDPRLLP